MALKKVSAPVIVDLYACLLKLLIKKFCKVVASLFRARILLNCLSLSTNSKVGSTLGLFASENNVSETSGLENIEDSGGGAKAPKFQDKKLGSGCCCGGG